MIKLRVLCYGANIAARSLLNSHLSTVAVISFASVRPHVACSRVGQTPDLVLLDGSAVAALTYFNNLRLDFAGLIVVLLDARSLTDWRRLAQDSNTLLFIKPVHVLLLKQLCEQQLCISSPTNRHASVQCSHLHLSQLEQRCFQALQQSVGGKMQKIVLQQHLFGDFGCAYDRRLNACWSRLGKKLARQAPQLQLRRTYNGFLEIATCAP